MIHMIICLVSQVDPFSLIHFLREGKKMGNDFTFVSQCVPISFRGLKKIAVDRQIALHCLLK